MRNFSNKSWEISNQQNQQSLLEDIFQCVRIRSHLPRLTNLENLTSNSRQFVLIYYREEQKEENDGNLKAFCDTRKRKNLKKWVNTKKYAVQKWSKRSTFKNKSSLSLSPSLRTFYFSYHFFFQKQSLQTNSGFVLVIPHTYPQQTQFDMSCPVGGLSLKEHSLGKDLKSL